MKSFDSFNLHPHLLKAVQACGFTTPTPIQEQAIPLVMSGRDVMASAQTGTGKTAAFVLPILQRLLTPATAQGRGPRVLVLAPTRELAAQVTDDIAKLGRFARFTSGSVVGGLSYGPQIHLLQRPLDLLVATPGRLLDHMNAGRVDYSRLEVFVLDEADRMLDMGFIHDVKRIASEFTGQHQSLLFSATLEGRVLEVARELLRDPARIQLAVNREQHASIHQRMHRADDVHHKRRLLAHHLAGTELTQALIFTATKRKADRLAKALSSDGHVTAALHGDMRQGARRRTVEHMKRGQFRLLVATDVAARGLDIKGISHVINFDLPMVAEDYIHRIGRTGRAGAPGIAISLVEPGDWGKWMDIERLTGRQLEREVIPGLEPATPEPAHGRRGQGGGRNHNSRPNGPSAGRHGRSRFGGQGGNRSRFEHGGRSFRSRSH